MLYCPSLNCSVLKSVVFFNKSCTLCVYIYPHSNAHFKEVLCHLVPATQDSSLMMPALSLSPQILQKYQGELSLQSSLVNNLLHIAKTFYLLSFHKFYNISMFMMIFISTLQIELIWWQVDLVRVNLVAIDNFSHYHKSQGSLVFQTKPISTIPFWFSCMVYTAKKGLQGQIDLFITI